MVQSTNDVCEVLYKESLFKLAPMTNMTATGNSCPRNYKLEPKRL